MANKLINKNKEDKNLEICKIIDIYTTNEEL